MNKTAALATKTTTASANSSPRSPTAGKAIPSRITWLKMAPVIVTKAIAAPIVTVPGITSKPEKEVSREQTLMTLVTVSVAPGLLFHEAFELGDQSFVAWCGPQYAAQLSYKCQSGVVFRRDSRPPGGDVC